MAEAELTATGTRCYMFHKNLIPVFVGTPATMEALVQEMKAVCERDPQTIPHPEASPDEETALARSKDPDLVTSGHLRFIELSPGGRPINVVLTLDTYSSLPIWNLSISIATGKKPIRVRDDIAFRIALAFLGEGYKEIEPIGYWKTVRQFIKLKEE